MKITCFGEKAVFLLTVFVSCFNFSNKFYNFLFHHWFLRNCCDTNFIIIFYYFVYFHRFFILQGRKWRLLRQKRQCNPCRGQLRVPVEALPRPVPVEILQMKMWVIVGINSIFILNIFADRFDETSDSICSGSVEFDTKLVECRGNCCQFGWKCGWSFLLERFSMIILRWTDDCKYCMRMILKRVDRRVAYWRRMKDSGYMTILLGRYVILHTYTLQQGSNLFLFRHKFQLWLWFYN